MLQLEGASETFWRGREVNERTLLSYRPGDEHVEPHERCMVWTALFCEPAVLDDTIRRMHGVDTAWSPCASTFAESDPAAVEGSDDAVRRAFHDAMSQLQRRISVFVSLPFEKLDRIKLQSAVREIGNTA